MIWLIGCNGMLGREMASHLSDSNLNFYSTDVEVDITSAETVKEYIDGKNIDTIINCAAYTQVDKAEEEQERAASLNCTAVENLVEAAGIKDAVLIHFSTDYVFSGSGETPYRETDAPDPQTFYGKTKLEGERIILEKAEKYFILRLSWLYGFYGKNFVHTMLGLFRKMDTINVVDDQYGSPTYAGDVADFVCGLVRDKPSGYGIYHFSGEGETSWHEFASFIYETARGMELVDKAVSIEAVPTSFFTFPASRPAYSYMDKTKLYDNFSYRLPDWRETVKKYLQAHLSEL